MKKIIIFMCCLFWMGFIFYMSSNNGQISHGQSTKVVSIIEDAKKDLEAEKQNNNAEKINPNKSTSNLNQVKESNLDHIVRKNAHGFMYMMLAVLVGSLLFTFNKKGKDAIVYILFVCLFYAVTDEFHQSFVPGRTSFVSDILIDFGGALIGLLIFYLFYYRVYYKYITRKS